MTTRILASTLALATLSLAACGPTATAGNAAADADTLTLNDDGAAIDNGDEVQPIGNDPAADNAATSLADNALAPAAGNAF
jgi:hypothetical protein